jgi:hypothetical protein
MPLFNFRRPNRAGLPRTFRAMRPAVMGFESKLLMSGATVNGLVSSAGPMCKMVTAEVTAFSTEAGIASPGTSLARKH